MRHSLASNSGLTQGIWDLHAGSNVREPLNSLVIAPSECLTQWGLGYVCTDSAIGNAQPLKERFHFT